LNVSNQKALRMARSEPFRVKGSLVAIVTPMHEDGSIDWASYRQLIDWHIQQGTDAIVAVGTTGESPTVTPQEHGELIKVAVEQSAGRVPIIAGTGGNSTQEAIELTAHAKNVGADATLQVVPYYNKPTQEGMYRHFKAVAEAVELPVILYNVPSRTVADMQTDTVLRLAEVPGIVGLKDATGDMVRTIGLLRRVSKDFLLYSGNDDSALGLMLLGGSGVISVTANIAPKMMAQMCAAALQGDVATAREINDRLFPLHTDIYVETNPIGVKFVLSQLGRCKADLRLPLVPLSASAQPKIIAAMKAVGEFQ
jgi:4-hydroxy-tetrahydrodipicolinate synthase